MIPAIFLELLELPLTANGKIDRAALPSPDYALEQRTIVDPRSFVEVILAQIWAEVLRRDRIGVDASFFELGGHSLLATQVVSRIHQALHVEIPLRELFDHPTLEDLAIIVEQSQLEQLGDDTLAALLGRLNDFSDEEVESFLSNHTGRMEKENSNSPWPAC
jgi:acyl carrier protein